MGSVSIRSQSFKRHIPTSPHEYNEAHKRVEKLSKRTDGTTDNRNVQFINFSDSNVQGRTFKQG